VTFLMTDIEGSTRLWEDRPGEMAEAIRRHDVLAHEILTAAGGILIKARGEGDSLFAVFQSAGKAMRAAIDFLRALEQEPWPGGIRLKSRAAVHSGEAIAEGDDYYGPTVNRCARLRSVAHGGQILLSSATKPLVASKLASDVSLRFLGTYRLKDIEQPEEIWQVVAGSLQSDFPALRTSADVPTNLESDLTTFVGRSGERTEIAALLEKHRMVTLTGAGGAGKSRLGVEIARSIMTRFPDGVWLVELADLHEGNQIAQAIQTSLRLPPSAASAGIESVVGALRDRCILLIIDNCEHLLQPVAETARAILRGLPNTRILATSREPVMVAGEAIRRVPSLSVPSAETTDLRRIAANESVALFVERASAHVAGFSLTAENAEAISYICRTLDGIPLALELAAARIRVLPPADLAKRLQDRFRILTRAKGGIPRHQTLRMTIEWSYKMISDLEREAFEQLSVFVGGWTLELAEQVCQDPIDEFELLDLITALVDKSLVNFEPGERGRYSFFETIRQFAREQLAERPDVEADLLRRHAEAMAGIGMDRVRKLRTIDEPQALQELVRDLPNLFSALAWAKRESQSVLIAKLSLVIGAAYQRRGYPYDGVGPIEEALALGDEVIALDPEVHARLLCERAALALDLLDIDVATPYAAKAHELAERFKMLEIKILAENLLGQAAMAHDDFALTRKHYLEALRLSEEAKNWIEMARLRTNLGMVERRDPAGNKELAASLYREALAIQRERHHSRGEAETLNSLGVLEQSRGNLSEAADLYLEAAKIEQRLNHSFGIAKTLSNYGEVLSELGQKKKALLPLGIAEHIFSQVRSPHREYTGEILTRAVVDLGWSAHQIDDFRASCGRIEVSEAITASLREE
jgi:predicted ATPase/class 3 adenylate cyclase